MRTDICAREDESTQTALLDEIRALRAGGDPANAAMLVANEPDARERSLSEYRGLLDEAGFDVVDVIQFEAPRDLIVARKRKSQ